jgi:hypothetical protein
VFTTGPVKFECISRGIVKQGTFKIFMLQALPARRCILPGKIDAPKPAIPVSFYENFAAPV